MLNEELLSDEDYYNLFHSVVPIEKISDKYTINIEKVNIESLVDSGHNIHPFNIQIYNYTLIINLLQYENYFCFGMLYNIYVEIIYCRRRR